MSNLYQSLESILNEKIQLYDRIIEVMTEEWTSITEYSRPRLEKAVEQKEALLAKVHELNHQRESLVKAFARDSGSESGAITLAEIIKMKGNYLGAHMAEQRKTIRRQIQQIRELNTSNKQLINRSALAMKRSVSWLYEVDAKYTPYYANGELSEPMIESRMVDTDI